MSRPAKGSIAEVNAAQRRIDARTAKDPKTKRGAVRQYNAIMRACRRDLSGGLSFGMDWPTMRVTFPERYARVQALRAMYKDLPA